MPRDNGWKRRVWSVRDDTGMVHRVAIVTYHWEDGTVRAFNVSSACRPVATRVSNTKKADWGGVRLPLMVHATFTIVEWNVHADPTCLGCLVIPEDVLGNARQ